MPFLDSLDIGNRVCWHLGIPPILSTTEDSAKNTVISDLYDKLRRAELQRNAWRFARRKAVMRPIDTTTMLVQPAVWNAATTYFPGAVVSDTNGQLWISGTEENVNNTPGQTAVWETYFGPLSLDPYDSTVAYFAGELVYRPTAVAGGYSVFLSLTNDNTAAPDAATAYDATVTYFTDQVVSYNGSQWRSLIPVNLNNTPTSSPTAVAWDSAATYAATQYAIGSDHYIYQSVGSGNIGHDPTLDTTDTYWVNTLVPRAWQVVDTTTSNPALPISALSWRSIAATVKALQFLYPIGAGPVSQSSTRNIFRLPNGWLRPAPVDAKAGSNSYLGAPSGLSYNDWELQGNFLVSSANYPLVYPFIADIQDVQKMDDMFCEGLACRIAMEACEILTQSTSKLQTIATAYTKFMGEARLVNAIDDDAVEPPEDDWVSCRA